MRPNIPSCQGGYFFLGGGSMVAGMVVLGICAGGLAVSRRRTFMVALGIGLTSSWCAAQKSVLAPTPPMGWNSWDAYGLTIDEQQFRANVDVLAKRLKPAWYEYAVVDEGWYLENPKKEKSESFAYRMDANGRYVPAPNRFPSAARDEG